MNQSKKARFLDDVNIAYLTKRMYNRHVADGGRISYDVFRKQVPEFMNNWRELDKLDSYESLIHWDPEVELEKINEDFVEMYWDMYHIGADRQRVHDNTNWGVDQWRNMDTTAARPQTVDASAYRYNNTFPKYQVPPPRHYDRGNDGLLGYKSREGHSHGRFGDMNLILEEVEKPVSEMDEMDIPYYGQQLDFY